MKVVILCHFYLCDFKVPTNMSNVFHHKDIIVMKTYSVLIGFQL